MYSTKPGVSVYGDFWYVLVDYQGKIFLNIPGNNPIPTASRFRILIRRAIRRQGLYRMGYHTRYTYEILDKISCLFQILKQILRQISPCRGNHTFRRISSDFCNMTKALFTRGPYGPARKRGSLLVQHRNPQRAGSHPPTTCG